MKKGMVGNRLEVRMSALYIHILIKSNRHSHTYVDENLNAEQVLA